MDVVNLFKVNTLLFSTQFGLSRNLYHCSVPIDPFMIISGGF